MWPSASLLYCHFSTPHSVRCRKARQECEPLHLFCYHPSFEAQFSPRGKERETTGNIYFVLPKNILPQFFIFFFFFFFGTDETTICVLFYFVLEQRFQFFSTFSLLKQKLLWVTNLVCFILTLKYIALKNYTGGISRKQWHHFYGKHSI